MPRRIALAYKAALQRHGLNQSKFAERIGVKSDVLTKFVQGQGPNDDLLKALFKGWPDEQTGWEILQAHLLDECERAGAGSPRLVVEERSSDERFLEDLRKLEAFFRQHPDLHSSLQELAEILDQGKNARAEEIHEVAEAKGSPVVAPKRKEVSYPIVKAGTAARRKR